MPEESIQSISDKHFPTFKKHALKTLDKWKSLPSHHRTLLKILPIFIILAAIPITTRLAQQEQNLRQEAAQHCRGNNPYCISPTPTPTVSILPTNTPTPTVGINPTPTPTPILSTPTPTPIATNAKYLATNGNDANSGSITAPWANIYTALTKLKPGDTLYIRSGTYNFGGVNYTSVAGTATSPILITNYPGESVVFNGTTTPADFLYFSTNAAYVTLRGFTVQGGGVTTDSNGSSLIGFINNANHITLDSMTFNASSTWGSEQHLVYIAQNLVTNINVTHSNFNGNGCLCAGLLQYYHDPNVIGSLIQSNTFKGSDQGVMIWAAGSGIQIDKNNFLNNRIAIRYHNSNGTIISNNTGTGNSTGIYTDTTTNLTQYNNIFN